MIVGAGGHGKVVADALQQAHLAGAPEKPIGFLDDERALVGTSVLGLPVLGAITQLESIPHDAVVVAVGDNATRRRLFEGLASARVVFATVRHPSAIVGQGVNIGAGVMICAGVVINPDTQVGDNVILNTSCSVDHDCVVADHVHIAPGVRIGGQVRIGEQALVGIGATIMPECHVGARAVVGAGACVTRPVGADLVVVGTPAAPRHV